MRPGLVLTTARTHFGDDHKTVRIRMQRLLNELVSYVWAIIIARIDMVNARRHRFPQHVGSKINITRRPPNLRLRLLSQNRFKSHRRLFKPHWTR